MRNYIVLDRKRKDSAEHLGRQESGDSLFAEFEKLAQELKSEAALIRDTPARMKNALFSSSGVGAFAAESARVENMEDASASAYISDTQSNEQDAILKITHKVSRKKLGIFFQRFDQL